MKFIKNKRKLNLDIVLLVSVVISYFTLLHIYSLCFQLHCIPVIKIGIDTLIFIGISLFLLTSFYGIWKYTKKIRNPNIKIFARMVLFTISISIGFFAFVIYVIPQVFGVSEEAVKLQYGTPPSTYYIERFSPIPEGDYAYRLYKQNTFLTRELIGETGRLYIYRGFDPSNPNTTITFYNPQKSSEKIFYYHIGSQKLEVIK